METKLIKARIYIEDIRVYMKIEEQDESVRLFLVYNSGFMCPDTGIEIFSGKYPILNTINKAITRIYVRGIDYKRDHKTCLAFVKNTEEEKRRILTALKNLCEAVRASHYTVHEF